MLTVREERDAAALPRVRDILVAAFSLHDGRIDPPSGAHRETVETLRRKLDVETLFVAELDGALSGCVWCRMDRGGEAYVGRLAVDPTAQGNAIGAALFDRALAWAREQQAHRVHLGVRVELTENIAFFSRRGFRIESVEAHPGYDRPTNYHMVLELSGPHSAGGATRTSTDSDAYASDGP